MELDGRTALVTGASSGIGAACAKQLSMAGARVILCGRDKRRLEAVAQQLPTPVAVLSFDVRDPNGLRLGIESLGDNWAHVDVLVSNAGVAIGSSPFADSDPEDWTEMVQVNLLGALHVIQTVLPGMIRRASGHVVTIGSIAGRQEYAGGAVYGATKAALGRLSAALRLELVGTGVRVSHVDPGLTETELWLRRFDGDASKVDAMFQGVQPLQAEDVSSAVLWLLTRPEHVTVADLFLVPSDRPMATKKPLSK